MFNVNLRCGFPARICASNSTNTRQFRIDDIWRGRLHLEPHTAGGEYPRRLCQCQGPQAESDENSRTLFTPWVVHKKYHNSAAWVTCNSGFSIRILSATIPLGKKTSACRRSYSHQRSRFSLEFSMPASCCILTCWTNTANAWRFQFRIWWILPTRWQDLGSCKRFDGTILSEHVENIYIYFQRPQRHHPSYDMWLGIYILRSIW